MDSVLSLLIAICIFCFYKMWEKENFIYFKTYSFMILLVGILSYINSFKVL